MADRAVQKDVERLRKGREEQERVKKYKERGEKIPKKETAF